jgi:hypothetical protein
MTKEQAIKYAAEYYNRFKNSTDIDEQETAVENLISLIADCLTGQGAGCVYSADIYDEANRQIQAEIDSDKADELSEAEEELADNARREALSGSVS